MADIMYPHFQDSCLEEHLFEHPSNIILLNRLLVSMKNIFHRFIPTLSQDFLLAVDEQLPQGGGL
jgi:hypothetical protein